MVDIYQAIATLVVIGCLVAIVWLHQRALRLGYVSHTVIQYELLIIAFVVISSIVVDLAVFDGAILLNHIVGPGLVDYVQNYIANMSNLMVSFVWFVVMCMIAGVMFALYFIYLNRSPGMH